MNAQMKEHVLRTFQNSSTRSYASAKKKITADFKYSFSLPAQALQHVDPTSSNIVGSCMGSLMS
jgi:hypothetical protein